MKTKKAIRLGSVAAVVVVAVLWLVFVPDHEPVYKGKKMSVWINALGDRSLGDTFTLEREFAKMGPDAVPAITQALRRRQSFFHKAYAAVYPRLPSWIRSRLSRPCDAVMVRCNAINVLGFMGTNAAPALPALLRALDDNEATVRQNAAGGIGSVRGRLGKNMSLDSEVVARLIEALRDRDPVLRKNAAASVAVFLDAATNAVPVLAELILTDKAGAKANAMHALSQIGRVPEHIVPAIRAALEDADKEVRRAASNALERIQKDENSRIQQ